MLTDEDFAALNRMIYNYRRYLFSGIIDEYLHRRRGSSHAFYDYKAFTRGDDPRHIHWNGYLRHGKLFTKTFHEEAFFHLHLLVDNSGSMAFLKDKPPAVVRLACAMAYIAFAVRLPVAVSLLCRRDEHPAYLPARTLDAVASFVQDGLAAEDAAPTDTDRLTEAVDAYGRRHHRQSGIVLLISDFLYDPAALHGVLKSLLRYNFEVRAVHVVSQHERAPAAQLAGTPVRIRDVETGEARVVFFKPGDYEASFQAHLGAIDRVLRENQMPVLRLYADEPVVPFIRRHMLDLGIVRQ
jgi:uncharacterized protein (DUF58 family)